MGLLGLGFPWRLLPHIVGILQFRQDSRLAAVGCWDSTIRLLDVLTKQPLEVLRYRGFVIMESINVDSMLVPSMPLISTVQRAHSLLVVRCVHGCVVDLMSQDGRVSCWNLHVESYLNPTPDGQ